MAPEVLKVVGQVAGIGGIALGVVLLIFQDVIRKAIFPKLTKKQGYRLLILIVILVWSVAVIGVIAWVWVSTSPSTEAAQQVAQPLISNLEVTTPGEYAVVEGGLKAGARAFIDDRYIFAQVPALLEGATYIKTVGGDKCVNDPSFFALHFDVSRPVTLYVAHDDRYITKPSWLTGFFDKTEESVSLNLPGASAGRYTLYARGYPAGTVVLGSNIDGDCRVEGNYGMYSVIVVSK